MTTSSSTIGWRSSPLVRAPVSSAGKLRAPAEELPEDGAVALHHVHAEAEAAQVGLQVMRLRQRRGERLLAEDARGARARDAAQHLVVHRLVDRDEDRVVGARVERFVERAEAGGPGRKVEVGTGIDDGRRGVAPGLPKAPPRVRWSR